MKNVMVVAVNCEKKPEKKFWNIEIGAMFEKYTICKTMTFS